MIVYLLYCISPFYKWSSIYVIFDFVFTLIRLCLVVIYSVLLAHKCCYVFLIYILHHDVINVNIFLIRFVLFIDLMSFLISSTYLRLIESVGPKRKRATTFLSLSLSLDLVFFIFSIFCILVQ